MKIILKLLFKALPRVVPPHPRLLRAIFTMFQDGLQASRLGASVPRTACLNVLGLLKTLISPLEHGFRRLHEVHGASEYVRPREDVLAVITEAVTAHGTPRQSCEVAAAQALRPFGRPLFKDDARAVFEVGEVAHRHRKCGHLASFLFRPRGSTSLELSVSVGCSENAVHAPEIVAGSLHSVYSSCVRLAL